MRDVYSNSIPVNQIATKFFTYRQVQTFVDITGLISKAKTDFLSNLILNLDGKVVRETDPQLLLGPIGRTVVTPPPTPRVKRYLPVVVDIYTLRPRQNGRHVPDDIFICILLNENV